MNFKNLLTNYLVDLKNQLSAAENNGRVRSQKVNKRIVRLKRRIQFAQEFFQGHKKILSTHRRQMFRCS